MNEKVEKLLENRTAMVIICLGIAAGAVVSIAAGFFATYKIVTFLGAS